MNNKNKYERLAEANNTLQKLTKSNQILESKRNKERDKFNKEMERLNVAANEAIHYFNNLLLRTGIRQQEYHRLEITTNEDLNKVKAQEKREKELQSQTVQQNLRQTIRSNEAENRKIGNEIKEKNLKIEELKKQIEEKKEFLSELEKRLTSNKADANFLIGKRNRRSQILKNSMDQDHVESLVAINRKLKEIHLRQKRIAMLQGKYTLKPSIKMAVKPITKITHMAAQTATTLKSEKPTTITEKATRPMLAVLNTSSKELVQKSTLIQKGKQLWQQLLAKKESINTPHVKSCITEKKEQILTQTRTIIHRVKTSTQEAPAKLIQKGRAQIKNLYRLMDKSRGSRD